MVIVPLSSGSRSASSAARGNSGNSSRNSTPWCASEISPGRGGEPPPTSATALAVWCGARVGRRIHCASAKRLRQAGDRRALQRLVTSIAGSRPAKRCASIDLPEPGGPTISS